MLFKLFIYFYKLKIHFASASHKNLDAPNKPTERSKSAGLDMRRSFDNKVHKSAIKSKSTSHVSYKADPSKVLSYLKKTKYDDKGEMFEELNDNIFHLFYKLPKLSFTM